ncbi:hypothetical protein [Streptomyces sp. NPDC006739]
MEPNRAQVSMTKPALAADLLADAGLPAGAHGFGQALAEVGAGRWIWSLT